MNNTLSARTTRQAVAAMSDEALFLEYQRNRNQQFFTILYQRYTHLVFGACLKYIGRHEESRDMTMSIFEKIFRNPPVEEVRVFKSWLHKFIQNECFCYLRKHANRGDLFRKFEELEKREGGFAENEALQDLVNDKPPLKLEEAIKKLPMDQRKCIRLFYLKDKSYKQIIGKTGFTEKQVKSCLQNGKRMLKILMTEKDDPG